MKGTDQRARICWVVDAGLLAYGSACTLQRELVQARKLGVIPDLLLLCEHPHVITLGRNGDPKHLHAASSVLRQMQVEFHASDRGGDITYHGPGQLVGYPILDLAEHQRDVRWYVKQLEEVMIRLTGGLGIQGKRLEQAHGVWVDTPAGEEKLAALGVHLSRWVTSHGFAYNISTDLRYFDLIVPCGIPDKRATSVERLLGRAVTKQEALPLLIEHFGEVFERAMVPLSPSDLKSALAFARERREVAAQTSSCEERAS